jgi:hypothetical protein
MFSFLFLSLLLGFECVYVERQRLLNLVTHDTRLAMCTTQLHNKPLKQTKKKEKLKQHPTKRPRKEAHGTQKPQALSLLTP